MHELGFEVVSKKKGTFVDGHERNDVVEYRMERDLEVLLPLPATPYDASDKHVSRVSSLSLVRYRTNDYSVPVAYGHMEVVVRGYVGEVVISCGSEVIARHPRSCGRDDFVFDPIHYLPLTCHWWSARREPWTRPHRWPGGSCRRSSEC